MYIRLSIAPIPTHICESQSMWMIDLSNTVSSFSCTASSFEEPPTSSTDDTIVGRMSDGESISETK